MGNITNLINNIKNAVFGKDVRKSICDAIEQCYEDAIANGHTDMEVAEARGSYSNLKERLNNDTYNLKKQITQEIRNVSNGTPLIANSLDDMTDKDRIYVLITDGHIYSWSGTNWIDVGVYQATEIDNESVDVLKFDRMLQKNYIKNCEKVEYQDSNVGYVKIENNELVIDESDEYRYTSIDLDSDETYIFSGYNYYVVCGLIVVDPNDSNKIVYSSRNSSSSREGLIPVNLTFKTNRRSLKAYISFYGAGWPDFAKNNVVLSKISRIDLNYNTNYDLNCLYSINGKFMHISSILGKVPTEAETNNTSYKVYKISKGIKYKVSSGNIWYVTGIVITNNNFEVLYTSSSENRGSLQLIDYVFVAEEDGYIILSNVGNRFTSSISIVDTILEEIDDVKKPYKEKKWAAMGDSLTDISTLGTNVKNYVDYVSEEIGLIPLNYGHAGSGYKARFSNDQAFYQIANTLDNDVDIITIFGSFNDTYTTQDNFGLGTIEDNTTDTILGSVNVTLDTLLENYPNAVIGVIIPTPWGGRNIYNATDEQRSRALNYINGLIAICEKRSIPYLNLFKNSNLFPWNEDFANMFFNGDTTHPNTLGHKRFAPQIVEFIKSLLY